MKATKYTISVTVEVLSMDAVYAKLIEAAEEIREEHFNGEFNDADGDHVSWVTDSKLVEF